MKKILFTVFKDQIAAINAKDLKANEKQAI